VVWILGARQVLQGVGTAAYPDAVGLAVGLDVTHVITMIGLAIGSRSHRRAALVSTAVSVGSIAAAAVAHRAEV
jgi:hypothetical protein